MTATDTSMPQTAMALGLQAALGMTPDAADMPTPQTALGMAPAGAVAGALARENHSLRCSIDALRDAGTQIDAALRALDTPLERARGYAQQQLGTRYSIAHGAHGAAVYGAIPATDLVSLIDAWRARWGEQAQLASETLRTALRATAVVVKDDSHARAWAAEVGA